MAASRASAISAVCADTTQLRGWWRNRVSRTLLVFLFSTLGSAILAPMSRFPDL